MCPPRHWTRLALVTVIAGCAHSPAPWDGGKRVVCARGDCFSVGPLPARWRVIQREGAEVGFFDESAGAAILGSQSCRADADEAPLATLTHHLLIGYTDRQVRSEGLVELDRREALRTVLDARLDGVAIVLDLYVLKKNNCIYDLSLAAPPSGYAAVSGDFATFVAGFLGTRRL